MGRKRRYKKADILEAIKGSYGIITDIAERLGCDWHTADDYIKLWPETMQAHKDEGERYLDLCEKKCIERVEAGEGQMIRFVLATKGKRRGYVAEETSDTDGTGDDTAVNINMNGGEPEPVEADA